MSEERGSRAAEPSNPSSGAFRLMATPLEFAARPTKDIGIDPRQGRTQLRVVEVAVVVDPTTNARIVHRG